MPVNQFQPVSPFGMAGTVPQGSAAPLQAMGALSGSPAANLLGNQYQSSYQTALANNQRQYADVLRGYQNTANQQYGSQQQIAGGMMGTLGQQMQGQNQVLGGYGNLGNQVQGYLGGMGQGLAGLQQAQQGIGQGYTNLGGQVQGALQPMQAGLDEQRAQNTRTQQGYTDLMGQVMGTINGVDASQRQAIQDQYVAAQGQAGQSLASRGLGNTTVTDSVQRGLLYDKQKSDIALSNQMAQLRAGYQSQLGLAGLGFATQANQMNTAQQNALAGQRAAYGSQLGMANLGYAQQASQQALAQQNLEAATRASYADQIGRQKLGYAGQSVANNAQQRNAISAFGNQALAANTGLAQNQLGWMNSVNSPYPNAAMYAQLQNQAGANQQGRAFATQQLLAQQQAARAQQAAAMRQGAGQGVYQGAYGNDNFSQPYIPDATPAVQRGEDVGAPDQSLGAARGIVPRQVLQPGNGWIPRYTFNPPGGTASATPPSFEEFRANISAPWRALPDSILQRMYDSQYGGSVSPGGVRGAMAGPAPDEGGRFGY